MRTPKRCVGLLWLGAIALAALGGAGCESGPYLSAYSYQPRPGIIEVRKHGAEQQAPPVTAMVSILGVRKADAEHHVPASIDVRFQFESNTNEPVSFDPSSVQLTNGMLRPLPRPYVTPPSPFQLSQGQQAEVSASFPLPANTTPEQMDLNELRLRWVVRVAGYEVPQTALFERTGSGYGGPEYQAAPGTPSDVAY